MNNNDIPNIPKEKLQFVKRTEKIHDVKFETKPIGYLQDAMMRFVKNKGSVVAAIIILILFLYAFLTPLFSKYQMWESDIFYKKMLPRNDLFVGTGFWDGREVKDVNQFWYDYYSGMPGAVAELFDTFEVKDKFRTRTMYKIDLDVYAGVGYFYEIVTSDGLKKFQDYEKENNIEFLLPMIDTSKQTMPNRENDPNLWYETNAKGEAQRDKDGNLVNIFLEDPISEYGDGYAHYVKLNDDKYKVRLLYSEYYKYKNGKYASFVFGSDIEGYDILSRLAGGARFSLLFGVVISAINIFLGILYGAIEGYYGGWVDLLLERISDILNNVPFVVVSTLFNIYLAAKVGPIVSIAFAFILTGWIGVAFRTRTQFYRFKGAEHILASRTLGAKDGRLIFKHILPNAIGTLITSSILMVPGVIFSESSLSYLGIIDLGGRDSTSVGTLLAQGRGVLADRPHVLFFPAAFLSLFMLAFNIFGNGLRDAFNPSLRGAE